eukprot:GHVQ01025225.1.p1 GENE.GHVQ01025225.1~~GHVQ01025225.1.p1  ORF type:complete len:690 (+),score=103.88 GHVQ01025225.1:268-2337(+)
MSASSSSSNYKQGCTTERDCGRVSACRRWWYVGSMMVAAVGAGIGVGVLLSLVWPSVRNVYQLKRQTHADTPWQTDTAMHSLDAADVGSFVAVDMLDPLRHTPLTRSLAMCARTETVSDTGTCSTYDTDCHVDQHQRNEVLGGATKYKNLLCTVAIPEYTMFTVVDSRLQQRHRAVKHVDARGKLIAREVVEVYPCGDYVKGIFLRWGGQYKASIKNDHTEDNRPYVKPPPTRGQGRKVIVVDIDKTLAIRVNKADNAELRERYGHARLKLTLYMKQTLWDGSVWYTYIRPDAEEFIAGLKKLDNVKIYFWTAGNRALSEPLIKKLMDDDIEPYQMMYSTKCTTIQKLHSSQDTPPPVVEWNVKDLRKVVDSLGRRVPLADMMSLDDKPSTSVTNPDNMLALPEWVMGDNSRVLTNAALPAIQKLQFATNIPAVLRPIRIQQKREVGVAIPVGLGEQKLLLDSIDEGVDRCRQQYNMNRRLFYTACSTVPNDETAQFLDSDSAVPVTELHSSSQQEIDIYNSKTTSNPELGALVETLRNEQLDLYNEEMAIRSELQKVLGDPAGSCSWQVVGHLPELLEEFDSLQLWIVYNRPKVFNLMDVLQDLTDNHLSPSRELASATKNNTEFLDRCVRFINRCRLKLGDDHRYNRFKAILQPYSQLPDGSLEKIKGIHKRCRELTEKRNWKFDAN